MHPSYGTPEIYPKLIFAIGILCAVIWLAGLYNYLAST